MATLLTFCMVKQNVHLADVTATVTQYSRDYVRLHKEILDNKHQLLLGQDITRHECPPGKLQ